MLIVFFRFAECDQEYVNEDADRRGRILLALYHV